MTLTSVPPKELEAVQGDAHKQPDAPQPKGSMISSLTSSQQPLGYLLMEVARLGKCFSQALPGEDEAKQSSQRYKDAHVGKKWPQHRIQLAAIMRSQKTEFFMGLVIVFNLIIIIMETDYNARCYPMEDWTEETCPYKSDKEPFYYWVNWVLLVMYSIEAALRLYVDRRRYFLSKWNNLDFIVVLFGWLEKALPDNMITSVAFLRIFRLARLTRTFRVLLSIRELYLLIGGLAGALRAIFWGMLLLFLLLILWSIVLVEVAHKPTSKLGDYFVTTVGCTRCPHAFRDVKTATFTLFQQIVTGDSWGLISLPLIEKAEYEQEAYRWLMFALLASIVITVSLGVMNLILAVVVDSAVQAREDDIAQRAKNKKMEQQDQKAKFLKLCQEMDADGSKTISLAEMHLAWEQSEEFQTIMTLMDIQYEELEQIFQMFDTKKAGEVLYEEFVDQLFQLKNVDLRMLLAIMKHRQGEDTAEIRAQMKEQGDLLQQTARQLASLDMRLVDLGVVRENTFVEPLRFDPPPVMPQLMTPRTPRDKGGQLDSNGLEMAIELAQLQRFVDDFAQRRTQVLQRAEEQASAISRQAELLSSACKALEAHRIPPAAMEKTLSGGRTRSPSPRPPGPGARGPTPGGGAAPEPQMASEQLAQLRRHVSQRMGRLLQDMERRVDEEAGAIASSDKLIQAFLSNLKEPAATASTLGQQNAMSAPVQQPVLPYDFEPEL